MPPESPERNQEAKELAKEYYLPDSAEAIPIKKNCVGLAYTKFADKITCESDLIAAVRRKAPIRAGASITTEPPKRKIGAANNVLVYSFWLYNKTSGLLRAHKRHAKVKYLDIGQPRTHDAGG